MPATYEKIAAFVSTGQSTFQFDSIPQTYTDLRLVISGRLDANIQLSYRFNNNSSSLYYGCAIRGSSSTASQGYYSQDNKAWFSYLTTPNTSQPFLMTMDLIQYTGSQNKSALTTFCQDLNGSGGIENGLGMWQNTAAVNRIDVLASTYQFLAGTKATLYGIKKA